MPEGAHGQPFDDLLGRASRKAYVATVCEADVKHFCGNAISGDDRIASCMQTHFGEVSDSCKSALAYIDAPNNNP